MAFVVEVPPVEYLTRTLWVDQERPREPKGVPWGNVLDLVSEEDGYFSAIE